MGTSHGSIFSSNEPGKNPLSSFDTVGLVITILFTSLLKNISNAIWHANRVLPLPALPTIKLNGCCSISDFDCFCSSDNDIENLTLPFGGVFVLFSAIYPFVFIKPLV